MIAARWLGAVGGCVVLCAAAGGAGPVAAEAPPRNLVVLVDASTSMDDIMPTVHNALSGMVDDLQIGDRCVVFGFGDQVRRIGERDIEGDEDRAALRASIAKLQPTDRFTDITSALQRGIVTLQRDARFSPERVPILLLLTDGRHNPAYPEQSPSFDELLVGIQDFTPGKQWFMQYLVLRADATDEEMLAFVTAVKGAYTLAPDEDTLRRALGSLNTPVECRVLDAAGPISVRPADVSAWRDAVVNATVVAGDAVETGASARAVVQVGPHVRIGLEHSTIVEIVTAQWDPIRVRGAVRLRITRGAIELHTAKTVGEWDIQLETPSGTIVPLGTRLRLSVDSISGETEVAVRRGAVQARPVGADDGVRCPAGQVVQLHMDNTAEVVAGISPSTQGLSRAWDGVLEKATPLRTAGRAMVAAVWSSMHMRVGPIERAQVAVATLPVSLAGLDDPVLSSATVQVRAALPPGLILTAVLQRPEGAGPSVVRVEASAASDFTAGQERELGAELLLMVGGPDAIAAFPLTVTLGDSLVAFDGPEPIETAEDTTKGWVVVLGLSAVTVLALVLVYGVGSGRIFLGRRRRHTPGRLLIVENPAHGEQQADFIRLDQWEERPAKKPISVGRSKYCDIVLPHASVRDHHCNIRLVRSRAGVCVEVDMIEERPITLDGEDVTAGSVVLPDRAQLGVGDFVLQYEDSSAKPQVLVHLATGETVRGALHSWDITAPYFSLAPDDPDVKLPGGPIPDIRFPDVQDVAMLRMEHEGRRTSRRTAWLSQVEVRFPQGRVVHGALWADYDSHASMFSIFPDDQPDVDYMVIVRANTEAILRDGAPEPAGKPNV